MRKQPLQKYLVQLIQFSNQKFVITVETDSKKCLKWEYVTNYALCLLNMEKNNESKRRLPCTPVLKHVRGNNNNNYEE